MPRRGHASLTADQNNANNSANTMLFENPHTMSSKSAALEDKAVG